MAAPPAADNPQSFSGASLRLSKVTGPKSGNMSVANSAIFSSRDNTHPVLNAQLIGKARAIFASYCALCVDPQQQQQQPVAGTVSAGVSVMLPAGHGIDVGHPQQQPAGLNAKGIQRYMADVGCSVSENEAKDIIFALSQSGVILHKNAEAERQGADGSGEGIRSMMSCRSLNSVTTAGESEAAAAGSGRNLLLTFPLFLELLMSTQSDCLADVEIQAMWNRLDRDADGVLGVSDIRESLAGLSYAAGGSDFCNDELQVLSQMSAVEIQTLLREYDLDADGLVTFDDLRKAVETS